LLFPHFWVSSQNPVRILLTADLHFHRPWFEWILRVADRYDLVCVAGDLLNIYHPDGFVPQLIYVFEWVQQFVKLPSNLALCSGNHDLPVNLPLLKPGDSIRKDKLSTLSEYAKNRRWLRALRLTHQVAVDEDSKMVRSTHGEFLSVLCFPYEADGRVTIPECITEPALILHHEPPAQTRIAEPKGGNREFALFVARRQPAWTLSGHVHYTAGEQNHFFQTIGRTCCFNCRQIPIETVVLPPEPNFISLDTRTREVSWFHWIEGRGGAETKAIV
jgi:hypothetical protein